MSARTIRCPPEEDGVPRESGSRQGVFLVVSHGLNFTDLRCMVIYIWTRVQLLHDNVLC